VAVGNARATRVINLHVDAAGRLVGVEVLAARRKLAPELLAAAETSSQRPLGGS
jgi:hypothetical protein